MLIELKMVSSTLQNFEGDVNACLKEGWVFHGVPVTWTVNNVPKIGQAMVREAAPAPASGAELDAEIEKEEGRDGE